MEEKKITTTYSEFDSIEQLPMHLQNLLLRAREARLNAYAPYSGFLVGAASLLENEKIVIGNNQENASFPVGICAERVSLTSASAQFPESKILAIAITAGGKNNPTTSPVMPCGICRQTILEYETKFKNDIELVMQGNAGKIFLFKSIKQLLPLSFASFDF